MDDTNEKNWWKVLNVARNFYWDDNERKLFIHVVKMLAVMESKPESTDPVMEFLVTGRTGRRNAMADILGPHATVTSGDLPEKLQSLTTVDDDSGPSTSSRTTGKVSEDTNKDCHTTSQQQQEQQTQEANKKSENS